MAKMLRLSSTIIKVGCAIWKTTFGCTNVGIQIEICGGKPDERKELSNSLRNDSLLDKLVDELAKGKAMEKIKRTNK